MNSFIDLRTAIVMASLLGGLMAGVLELLYRSAPQSVPGLRQWANASWLVFVTALLFGLRGMVPAVVSVTLANGLLLATLVVMLKGTCHYTGHTQPWRRWWLLCGVSLLGLAWYTHVDDSFRGRVVWVVGTLGLLVGAQARLFFLHPARSLGVRFVRVVLTTMALIFALRWWHAVLFDQGAGQLYGNSLVQSVYMASYTFVLLLIMVGYVLLASERMREAFEYQASHDPLTGVYNRRELLERLAQELARSRRYQTPFSVLALDLDHFKQVNDTHGHQVGDEVLKLFVRRVTATLRPTDLLGRMGGEEFLVVLPQADAAAAQATAQRLLPAVAQTSILPMCTVSIGVTQWQHDDGTVDALLARADAALYRAKAQGRNRVELG